MGNHRKKNKVISPSQGLTIAVGLALLIGFFLFQMALLPISLYSPAQTPKPKPIATPTPTTQSQTYSARPSLVLFPENPKYPYNACNGNGPHNYG